jgi:hypothetical protein
MPNLAMEAIWVDQSRESDRIESSPWHKHFLEATNGATKFHGFVVSSPMDDALAHRDDHQPVSSPNPSVHSPALPTPGSRAESPNAAKRAASRPDRELKFFGLSAQTSAKCLAGVLLTQFAT